MCFEKFKQLITENPFWKFLDSDFAWGLVLSQKGHPISMAVVWGVM